MTTTVQCSECHYVRIATDTAPDYECPKCGIVYAKFDPVTEAQKQALRVNMAPRQADAPPAPATSWVRVTAPQKNPAPRMEAGEDGIEHIPGNLAVCKHCEEIGQVDLKMPGNGWVEFVLYLCYIAPGIIYSVWRRKGKKQVCGACRSDQLVAAKTRMGQQIIAAQIPNFKIGKNDNTKVTYRKPIFGKTTAVLLSFFTVALAVQGIVVSFIAERTGLLGLGSIFLAVFCGIGAYNIFKQKPIPVISDGQSLIGW